MASFCFVHAADLHLDTPFQGVGRVAPGVADILRDASLDAWDALVQLTIDRGASFLVLAGDLYDGPERGVRAQLRFLRGVGRLAEKGIRAFVVYGNHDALEGWSAVRNWPENLTVFGSDNVGSEVVERDGERLAVVHGISYDRRDVTENLALRLQRGDGPGVHVGVLHCNVGGVAEHESYSPCSLEDLRQANMDYWALGHIHRRRILREGDPWIAYSGNTQGRSPKPAEQGAKGALVVEVDDGGVASASFAPTDCVRFASLTVDVSEMEDFADLHYALSGGLDEVRSEHSGKGVLLRVLLTGRGGLHDDLRRPALIEELLRDLREESEDESSLVWWEDIIDRTRPAVSREAVLRRNDFSAELLRQADALRGDPDRLAAFLADKYKALSRPSSVRKWLGGMESQDAEELLREAEDLALDLLEGETD